MLILIFLFSQGSIKKGRKDMEEEQDMHIASRGSLLVILALLLGIHIFAFRS